MKCTICGVIARNKKEEKAIFGRVYTHKAIKCKQCRDKFPEKRKQAKRIEFSNSGNERCQETKKTNTTKR